jgi:hypothetical protein
MATDVARLSFDPARFYRGVVPQQGRVSLEAEQNEQRAIDIEERRKELVDIVGPAGTPDDGYAVSGAGGSLTVSGGTMYVGGWRVELDADLGDAQQPDWLDRPVREGKFGGREHVLLWLQETDVTAVEDPALYEVALGGPDGAARSRLLQRILRLPTEGDTCAAALAEDRKRWLQQGLTYEPATVELASDSRLLVTWEGDPEPASPCEPSSTGGYLGAENQCIRVQLTQVNADGTVDFVWGYDDASFLYRVTADASANPVLTLDRTPVDDFHRPRAGQAVQALRSTAQLASTDGIVEGYVAALGGEVGVLGAPYDPDIKAVQFPAPLPAAYTDPDENPQLYLRVWDELITSAALGTPISLTGTGMQITISITDGGALHENDFWCIGVRPTTPTTVYPDRYLRAPQPPDGPRQWVCPLAVIKWEDEKFVVLEDCRRHFKPLVDVEDTGCCTIEVGPSDAARLQELVDKAAAGRVLGDRGDRITICFQPGRYELAAPLVLQPQHSHLTLRGCADAAVLTVADGQEAEFGQGMLLLLDVDNVTITGFEFAMPQVPAALGHVQGTTGGVFGRDVVRAINAAAGNQYVSVAIRTVDCAVLEIDNCLFRFTVGERQTTLADAQTMPRDVFGAGVFAAGGLWGLRLTRNRFLHHPTVPVTADGLTHLLAGFVHAQTALSASTKALSLGASQLRALLDDAAIVDNEFHGLTAAVAVVADVAELRVRDNVVRDCYGGIWLLDAAAAVNTDLVGKYAAAGAAAGAADAVHGALSSGLFDPVLLRLLVLAALYPLPRPGDLEPRGALHLDTGQIAQLRERSAVTQRAYMSDVVERLVSEHPSAEKGAKPKAAQFAATESPAPDRNLLTIWRGLAELGRLARPAEDVTTSVRVERNSVDCRTPGDDATTGPALFAYLPVDGSRSGSAVAVDGNRLVSRSAPLAAGVIGGTVGTVNANTVLGDSSNDSHIALAVTLVAAAAITGNVVAGRALLPENRPFPVPLDTWRPLNTIS